jgi:hypothetical protein
VSYRPTEFEVNNSGGIGCDIRIDPETIAGGTMFFQVEQDSESVTVSLECLENLLACANKLLQGWRETRSDAQTHNAQVRGCPPHEPEKE